MNDRLAKLRQETIRIKKSTAGDFSNSHDSATMESRSDSKNSDSHLSPRSTNASRVITDDSANGAGQYQNSQVEFYKSESSFKQINQNFQR